MITFEANVICDGCEEALVTGEPGPIAYALKTAKDEAKAAGWHKRGLKWYCLSCHERNQSDGKKDRVLK